ncbi:MULTISPECIES: MFS transporter [unclassified Modicisalibacter]|uniref:MFS transporter n=1 Tax=unclassified Modicisalibacter TaxID=2679913 RepID=UPI001CCC67F5|nr:MULTISPECIES: MFS transporter [unclassified Modicisalibacter]MBZ9558004.1 MFS transporter [Modicisalibacter sp. R2A 31.J]MBZ9573328.1 MFS transporter [Modicisalibacter sp. MOD 31.J]
MTEPTSSVSSPGHRGSADEPWNRVITKKQIGYASLVCFIAWVASVYDYTLFGTLLPVIADDFGWSPAKATAVNTWATIGVFFVSLVVGTMLDHFGRKKTLILLVIGGAVSSGLSGVAIGAASLVIIRAFSGFAVSEEVVNAVYLNEIYKKAKGRGFMYSLVQSGWPVGALCAAGMTSLLLPVVGWRGSFFVAACASIIVIVMALKLPESPVFAAMKEVERRRKSGDAEGAAQLAAEHDVVVNTGNNLGLKGVLAPELRRHTISLSLVWLFSWMAIQVFAVLGTTVLVEAKGVSFESSLYVLILANAVGFVGYLTHGWVGDRIGRRNTVLMGFLLGGVASLLMLLGPASDGFVYLMYAITLFFLLGPFAAILFYMGESFPAHVRGTGANVAHVMAPVGAIVGSGLVSLLLTMGVTMTWAAILAGSLPLLLSGLLMFGTRHVDHRQHDAIEEAVA